MLLAPLSSKKYSKNLMTKDKCPKNGGWNHKADCCLITVSDFFSLKLSMRLPFAAPTSTTYLTGFFVQQYLSVERINMLFPFQLC